MNTARFLVLTTILFLPVLQAEEQSAPRLSNMVTGLVGHTKADADDLFGIPNAQMEFGEQMVLLYKTATVMLADGKVQGVQMRDLEAEAQLARVQEEQMQHRAQAKAEEEKRRTEEWARLEKEQKENEEQRIKGKMAELEQSNAKLAQEVGSLERQVSEQEWAAAERLRYLRELANVKCEHSKPEPNEQPKRLSLPPTNTL